ncbi:MAG: hypothetical protein HY289_11840 [Planctomycetes bacterium]|nr:hypothetical protein [Planctomycetota bacterium]
MRTVFTIAAALVLAGIASAQPGRPLPAPPPVFKIVSDADKDKGRIIFQQVIYKYVPVTKEVVEIVNGVAVKKAVTEYVVEAVTERHVIDVGNSKIITPDGKRVPDDILWTRIKKDAVVVVSADGNTPAPAFLRALNAETVVIIPPVPKIPPPPPLPKN